MILLVNGPNLNLLGEREPEVYGAATLADVEKMVAQTCAAHGVEVRSLQSNSEGALIDFIHAHRRAARGIIVNPGALTHTSYALHDCLKAVPAPAIEVHVSNVHAREAWRRVSVVAPAARGQIAGLGVEGYRLAALWLCQEIARAAAAGEPAPRRGGRAAGAQPGPGHEGARPVPVPATPGPDPVIPSVAPPEAERSRGTRSRGTEAPRSRETEPARTQQAPRVRGIEPSDLGSPHEDVPVDITKRGDYEPL